MIRGIAQAAAVAGFVASTTVALAQPKPDTANIWTLQDENASISTSSLTDRFYTNGLKVGWMSGTDAVPGFLASMGRSLWGNGQQRVGFSITQQIYTPGNTDLIVADPHDRPYAGVLLGNFSLLSDTDDSRSLLMVSLGVLGPGAGGKASRTASTT